MRRERLAPVLAFAVFGLFWGTWDALLPAIKQATGVDDGQLGLALLGIGVGALPVMLSVGPLADRLGRPTVADMLVLFALVAVPPVSRARLPGWRSACSHSERSPAASTSSSTPASPRSSKPAHG